ncbi:MAG: DUF692 family protein, partial [Rhizonema sp. PD37]|nr:DUF692 family protein [Rhizonema sp. PD37]
MTKIGLTFRRVLNKTQVLNYKDSFDCLEFLVEEYSALSNVHLKELRNLSNLFTLIPHGLSLSIGSVERPPQSYLDTIARLLEIVQPKYYSEHFAFTQTSQKNLDCLSPLWYTNETLDIVIKNVINIQSFLGLPLILENIAHPFNLPCSTLSQEDFITAVCNETKCGILLDITNLFIDFKNFGSHPKKFIERLPKSSIKQLHIAGYLVDKEGFLWDTHSSGITQEIWELYD